jgi:phosphoglycolate phosphatase-like HAD superfamily hydrolase
MNLVVFDIDGTLVQVHRKGNDSAYVQAVRSLLGVDIADSWNGFGTSAEALQGCRRRPCAR